MEICIIQHVFKKISKIEQTLEEFKPIHTKIVEKFDEFNCILIIFLKFNENLRNFTQS